MFGFRNKRNAQSVAMDAPPGEPGAAPSAPPAKARKLDLFEPRHAYEWGILRNPPPQIYGDAPDPRILELLPMKPSFALDIGCNTGSRGYAIKQHFPDCQVWGVEPNPNTAEIARGRLDRVISELIDDIDWAAFGVAPGAIDTVLLFDVLEHIYDPWSTLLRLRNLVSANAQLVLSVPNVRNVFLIEDLLRGIWRYRPAGLLDITHIRFFTQDELMRLIYQTGFRLLGQAISLDEACKAIMKRHQDGPFPQQVEIDSATITVHSHADLESLCAVQNIRVITPARYEELSADEKAWVDAPHPATRAYAGGL